MHQIRLFIMCHNQGVRRGLTAIFEFEDSFEVVGDAEYGPDAIAGAQKIQPDLILCETTMGEDNAGMIRTIKESCPYSKVFLFANNDMIHEACNAIAAGADGCLSKTMLPSHLVKVVELTCRTEVLCLPGSFKRLLRDSENIQGFISGQKKMDDRWDSGNGGNGEPGWKSLLTAREMEIYRLIIQNCSNKEIGEKLFISLPTVKSHVSSILRKLGLNNRTQLILYDIKNQNMGNFIEIKNESVIE